MSNLELKEIEFWTDQQLLNNSVGYNTSVKKLIEDKISFHENSSQIVSDWLKWSNNQVDRVKVVDYNVPQGVLPQAFKGCIYDIKVQGKRRAPDDTLYNKYADLR